MKNWLTENWFMLAIVILLLMIYSRLGDVKENTFYTADVVDASATRIIDSLDSRLERMGDGIDSIYRMQGL
ncbi:MAG: hypothetical protein AAB767_02290 [Patescibacteria group bacterium]